jgi:anti-sigma regulatory factor (Ser/Thr protein kinase)
MMLIEGSQSVPREEFGVELALREALNNAVVHGNQENPENKVRIHCRCGPGNEVSIVVTDQGRGFDFRKIVGNGFTSGAAAEHGRGIQLMKASMDEVHFERAAQKSTCASRLEMVRTRTNSESLREFAGHGKPQVDLREIIRHGERQE